MNARRIVSAALVIAAFAFQIARADQPEIRRTDLVKEDISISGKEAVQVRVDFDPGAFAVNHRHPGEEVAYVLQGTLEYKLEGREAVTLKAGQSLFIPDGVAHSARNVGDGKASELATYIVSRNAKLVEPVK
ncbi:MULTISPECIES: cupin domain-containing protein [unclassified Rhizobium]|uniref:cupin domain-containing protein n=1 Tax=unclassified Rhizobium TaxID=2613769 RepID=UPI00161222A5|nr:MULTISPECIES: cupin domain-containing protein [unclassified Rhizobium]MBB3542119.1 quercetin dioxygenase-like cupin family protein [Rhizobium sp. BK399]MCS3740301.1 quercetin dioxygenase-like cupin family protein [Rhizobium sp. BK661]MCS4094242.1 quercetin dioxygenase-like cupin family protein [Rhizobium sp. BK176]